MPLEDNGAGQAASVEVDSVPADENTLVTTTEFVCDCGCCQTVATERRVTKLAKPPAAIMRADGGYDSREVFSHCKKRGMRTNIRVRINSNCRADGVDRARSEAVLDQLGGGCTAARLAKMGRDERKKHQKEWKKRVGYNRRRIVEIIISAFKRPLGEALRAVKPEYIMMKWPPRWQSATRPGTSCSRPPHRTGAGARTGGAARKPPCAVRDPHGGRAVQVASGHELCNTVDRGADRPDDQHRRPDSPNFARDPQCTYSTPPRNGSP